MSHPGTPTDLAGQDEIAAGLAAALTEISQQARQGLNTLSPRTSDEEDSPNPLYRINTRRGTEFNLTSDFGDLDPSIFEPRGTMAQLGENITPRTVDAEIERMRIQAQNIHGERRQNIFDWDLENSITDNPGGRRYPFPRFSLPTARRTLFNDLPTVAENNETNEALPTEPTAQTEALAMQVAVLQRTVEGLVREMRRGPEEPLSTAPQLASREQRLQPQEEEPEYLELGLALRNIKSFDGNDPNKLDGFILSCEAVWERVRPRQRETLLALIRSGKLEDRATREMKHKNISTLKELRSELEALYGKRKSLASLQYEFCLLRQNAKESVSSYATRTERLTVEVIEKLCENIDPQGASYIEEATRKSAQMNFENGLCKEIQTIVRSRNYQSLHDSVVGAMEVEKMTCSRSGRYHQEGGHQRQSLSGAGSANLQCFICGKMGHIAKDCRQKAGRHSLPGPGPKKEINQIKVICSFCKKHGHDWKNCKLRLKQRENKSQTHQKIESNAESRGIGSTVGSFKINAITSVEEDKEQQEICHIKTNTANESVSDFHIESPVSSTGMLTLKADTGAQVCIINEGALKADTKAEKSDVTITGVGGRKVKALCAAQVILVTPAVTISHLFHVIPDDIPLGVHGFLGMDFIKKHNVDILGGNVIKLYGYSMPLIDGCVKIKLPPRSENITYAATNSKFVGVIEKSLISEGVILGACITSPQGNSCVVSMINTTTDEIEVERPTVTLEPLASANNPSAGGLRAVNTVSVKKGVTRLTRLRNEVKTDHLNEEEARTLLEICDEYEDIFHLEGDKLPCTTMVEHSIPLKEGTMPIKVNPYRLPEAHKKEVLKQTEEMLNDGIIQPSQSQWNAPLLVVAKKPDATGKIKMRVVVDFRKLNEATIGDSYPLPNISEILDKLGRAHYFTTLDLASGFHQIPMAGKDQEKTAFSTPQGHFEYTRMPFGLKNAPPTFQRLMNTVLVGLDGLKCYVYLDDIVIFGATLTEHNKRLREVFHRLRVAKLALQPAKCRFLRKETQYLGHVISGEGVRPDPSKIAAVKEFPTPSNVKGVQSFLGLAGYYRKFIKDFSKIAKPLTELIRKDTAFEWTPRQEQAFEDLKTILTTAPLLQYPDFEKPFVVTTDASDKAIGAILSQGVVGEDLPICYASRTLNKAEQNYTTTEKELLAIVWGIAQFRPYVYGTRFTVVTDHKPLTWLFSVKDPGSRLMRWKLKLAEHEFHVEYKAGKRNTNADALSRIYVATRSQVKRKAGGEIQCNETIGEKEENIVAKKKRQDFNTTPCSPEMHDCKEDCSHAGASSLSKEEKEKILQEHHDALLGGHQGVTRMLNRIRLRYDWPGIRKDVERYVTRCDKCQRNKVRPITKAPMVITDTPERAFQKCAMDIVGPLPETEKGNKYILTFQDLLTKYSIAIPLPTQQANEVARAFAEGIVCRYGTPDIVLTDQGTNFLSATFKGVCKLLRIDKIQTTAYHPESNGALERSHRTLAEYLKSYADEDQGNWDAWLPYAMFTYNTTPHTSTGYTPHSLVYGNEAELPTALRREPRTTYSYDDYAQELRERLRAAWTLARENLKEAKNRAKVQYDKHTRKQEYRVGDQVLLHDETVQRGRSAKLTPKWIGPYRVEQVHPPVNYTIQKGRRRLRVHVNRLKHYIDH